MYIYATVQMYNKYMVQAEVFMPLVIMASQISYTITKVMNLGIPEISLIST